MPTDLESDRDDQDQSEIFDEDNRDDDGLPGELRTFEEAPDVLDVTSALGDADDDEALIAEELDDDEIIALEAESDLEEDDGVDYAEEDGDDAPDNEGSDDEVELEYMGRLDGAPDVDSRQAAALEADSLDADDLDDLGYPGEDEPAQQSDAAGAQRDR